MSALQYLRKCSIAIGPAGGAGLDFSEFRCTFTIRRGDKQTPNSANIRILNVSDATARQIHDEFTQVAVQAGYDGNYGLIFKGTIKQVRIGRIDQRDTYVDVTAADGDEAYNFSAMAHSLAKGTKPTDDVQAFIATMGGFGITQAPMPEFSSNGRLRGRVFYGATRDELRDFAESNACAWSIQDGALTMIPLASYLPGDVPVISPNTGLIGVPEQIQNGISVRTLLNPYLKIGQAVKLDSTINKYQYSLAPGDNATNLQTATYNKINADGLYYVMVAEHTGDTRGNDWYTDLVCLAIDATVPQSLAMQAIVTPAAASVKMD